MASPNEELQSLLSACRRLMRSILTVSRDEQRPGAWPVRIRTAKRHVHKAVLALELDGGTASETLPGSLERIAATLTTRLVQDLMAEVDSEGPADVEARIAPRGDRAGLQGYTWAVSLPDIMGFLQMQQKSGVLRVNIGSEVVSLIFDRGDLIHACSDNSPPGTRLGEILVAQGAIDRKGLEAFLVRYSSFPGRLGDALEAEGWISKDELRRALDVQVEHIFDRLFSAADAYFAFREGHSEDIVEVRRNVFQLLLETCRVRDEAGSDAE